MVDYSACLDLLFIYKWWQNKRTTEESIGISENKRKRKLKYLLENQEKRETQQIADEDEFWELISFTKQKSKGNYKNQLGLLKDKFNRISENDIIELDNLISELYRKAFYYDSIINVNFMLKGDYGGYNELLITDVLAEAFYYKTNKLMPQTNMDDFQLEGKEWTSKELPKRFPNIWNKYA